MDVFPIQFFLKGEAIWLGWVSPEDGDQFFLTNGGYLIFSNNGGSELTREIMKIFPDANLEGETFFDIDSFVGRLDGDVILRDDFALNLWNLLTDLYHTFGGKGGMFFESRQEVYSRLFSQSEVASFVDVQRCQLSVRDIEMIREVISEGVDLLAQKIRVAKEARNH